MVVALPSEARAALDEVGRPVSFGAGDVVRRPGEPCDRVVVVLEGEIRVDQVSESGRSIELYRIRAGEPCVLEVSSALSGATYPARAVAHTAGRALAVSTPRFLTVLTANEALRTHVFSVISERLLEVMTLVQEVAFNRVDERLASVLLRERDEKGTVRATHEQLAEQVGTAREVVSRVIARLAADGVVTTRRGAIDVTRPDLLAERDPGH